jgi:tRNA (guanine9-N1)-methyltransferase
LRLTSYWLYIVSQIHLHEEPIESVYHAKDIIYLSPDADDVLLQLDANAVYVIGGIVDRSVRKGQSIGKASGNNYRAMRLPLQECMDVRKPVLNIDNVLIALNEFANHRNWTRAFEVAIPKRMATRRGAD